MKKSGGFTLVEILIVVCILGILAAIVIPEFSDASEQAKLSSLADDLRIIRSQIQSYRAQHSHTGNSLPGAVAGITFSVAMTKYTHKDGTLVNPQAPGPNIYGPYLLKIPQNPFNDSNSVSMNSSGGEPGDGSTGWWYNTTTGDFRSNDTKYFDL